MKKNKILRGVTIFSLLGMFVSSFLFAEGEKPNLVKNSGFETLVTEETEEKDWPDYLKKHRRGAPKDWVWSAKLGIWSKLKGISLDKETKWSGFYSLRLEASEVVNKTIVQHFSPGSIEPNTTYRLTYYIKTENIKPDPKVKGGACVNIWAGKNHWFPQPFFTGTMKWTKQGFEFTTGEESLKLPYIRLRIMKASGPVWFDNICLEKAECFLL